MTATIGGQSLEEYDRSRAEAEEKIKKAEAEILERAKPMVEASEERLKAHTANESSRRNAIEEAEYQYYRNMEPEMIPEAPVPQSEDQTRDFDRFGICLKNGAFYTPKQRGGTTASFRVSNFVFSILFQYNSDDGSDCVRLLKYENNDTGECGTLEMTDRQMMNFQEFKTVMAGKNCVFKGAPVDLASALQRAYLFQIKANYIRQLGWNAEGNFFAFSNAIVTTDGKTSTVSPYGYLVTGVGGDRRFYYLPQWAEANMNNGSFDEERRYLYQAESTMGVTRFMKLLYQAYGMNGFAAGLYLFASECYDIIFKSAKFFPYMFLFGKAGTGKTTLINFLLAAYGKGITGTSVQNSTMKGMARAFSQTSNGLIYLKEYGNDIPPEVDSLLKVAYDGQTYRIAQQSTDNRTKSFSVSSGIIIDGNEMPSNQAAVLDRCIVVELEKSEFSEEESKACEELKKEMETKGFTNLTVEATKMRDVIGPTFGMLYKRAQDDVRRVMGDGIAARTANHTALLLAMFRTLKISINEDIDGESSPDDWNLSFIEEREFVRWMAELCERKRMEMAEVEVTRIFFEAAAEAIHNNWNNIEDFYKFDRTAGLFYINYPKFYKEYALYCKATGLTVTASITIRKLLCAERAYCSTADDRFYAESGNGHRQRGMVFRLNEEEGTWTAKGVQFLFKPAAAEERPYEKGLPY